VARADAASSAAVTRQRELEGVIEALELKDDDWCSRAKALARRREEHAEREEIDRRRALASKPEQRLELPNLATKGRPRPADNWPEA
jgi:hypothetical protein